MRYFNEDKTIELNKDDLDFSKGYTVEDTLTIHHEAVEEVKEVKEEGHYETIAEYENGGKDVEWVIDKEGVQAQPRIEAYDEEEKIYVYKLYSEHFLKSRELGQKLSNLQYELSQTDYQAIKYAEGYYTEEEYKPKKQHREELREQIRLIQKEIEELENV